eukprot:GHVS01065271.1.p1 GENE.GHVS01065271.1~~GHVS01065271.1.p1  ORF type:complete len:877 (+),score=207.57 GHVS01065271.1:96-2726(+)
MDIEGLHLILPTVQKEEGVGYQTLQQLRTKANEYRKGYLNWRQNKSRGARGDYQDVFAADCSATSNLRPSELISLSPPPPLPPVHPSASSHPTDNNRPTSTETNNNNSVSSSVCCSPITTLRHSSSLLLSHEDNNVGVDTSMLVVDTTTTTQPPLLPLLPPPSSSLSAGGDVVGATDSSSSTTNSSQLLFSTSATSATTTTTCGGTAGCGGVLPQPQAFPLPVCHVSDVNSCDVFTTERAGDRHTTGDGSFVSSSCSDNNVVVVGYNNKTSDVGFVQTKDGLNNNASGESEEWLRFYFNPLTPVECLSSRPLRLNTLCQLPRNVIVPEYRTTADDNTTTTTSQNGNTETTMADDNNNTTSSSSSSSASSSGSSSGCTAGVYNVEEWIVHIGVGGFHRSHQTVYLDDLMELKLEGEKRWGICGVGLTESDRRMAKILVRQDYLYTVLTRSSTINEARVIGCLCDYVYVPEEPARILSKLSDVHTRIVSLTVTEKGYCQNTERHLDVENSLIKSDLQDMSLGPRSAIGLIVVGLKLRRELGVCPYTVMSCDNLPDNGNVTRRMVLEFARLLDVSLAGWIEENVMFPNTMVDRITPVTAVEHKELLARDFGVLDEWPVVTEEFRQWVIEDAFCNIRPGFEHVGVLFTHDVRPYEIMKLRLLNGGHSFLSYLSYLAGYRFVDDAVNDVLVSSFLRRYMDEMTSTIKGVNIELERYKEKIVERFGNKMIKDSLARIAEDGSTKFFNTMRDAILELMSERRHVYCCAFGLACFLIYMTGTDEQLQAINIKDPKLEELQLLANTVMASKVIKPAPLRSFLEAIFGDCPISSGVLVNEMAIAFAAIRRCGVQDVLSCGGPLHGLLKHKLLTMRGTMDLLEYATS